MRNDHRFNRALSTLQQQRSDEGIEGAVSNFQFHRQARKRGRWVLAAGLGTAACAVAVGLVFLTPKAQAFGLDDIQQALKSVSARHSQQYYLTGNGIPSNSALSDFESWQDGLKRRYRWYDTFDRGFDSENVWLIRPLEKVAIISREKPTGFESQETDLSKEIDNWKNDKGWSIKVSRVTINVNGKETLVITVDGKALLKNRETFRQVHYCDPKTKLPYKSEYYILRNSQYVKRAVREIDYPANIPDSVFAFNPPADYSLLDHRKALQSIKAGLNGQGPSKTVDGVTIRPLAALQEKDSTVMVLWAGGAMPNVDAVAGAFDDNGKGYGVSLYIEFDDRNRPRNHGKVDNTASTTEQQPKKNYHGSSADNPAVLRPLCWYGSTPIYAMQVRMDYQSPNRPRTLRVVLPICKQGEPRSLRRNDKGFFWQADGHQVGQAEFNLTTIPVNRVYEVIELFDKNGTHTTGPVGLDGINVDRERDRKITHETEGRRTQEMNQMIDIMGWHHKRKS